MSDRIVQLADNLWNIRGSFTIAKVIDIGTQCTLIRRASGGFLLLDAYTLRGEVLERVMALTDGGRAVQAVLHLHPFHTIHVRAVAERFPDAKQYGTRRHVRKAPDLTWEPIHTEDPELHTLFAEDLAFSVPQGVDLVPENEHLHFASVLAFHKASGTLHVDDTLMYSKWPLFGGLRFHPTLKSVLQPRAGAAAEFRAWCQSLVEQCAGVMQICPAHIHLPPRATAQGQIADEVRQAVAKASKIVEKHERQFG